MSSSIEQMQSEFHNRASAAFFSANQAFENAVSSVSRRRDEQQFQQLKKQYATALERELQTAAMDILSKYRNEKQVNEINKMFSQMIKDYLHRFIQKINDL